MAQLLFKEEYYQVVGICMEIHRILGVGLSEIVYKDAMEYEFKARNIPFEREKAFVVEYKDIVLPHKFFADFVVFDKIILEVKACEAIADPHITQTLNYIAIAKSRLGIIVNFGSESLEHKRVIL